MAKSMSADGAADGAALFGATETVGAEAASGSEAAGAAEPAWCPGRGGGGGGKWLGGYPIPSPGGRGGGPGGCNIRNGPPGTRVKADREPEEETVRSFFAKNKKIIKLVAGSP